jgi:hypothetical protein
MLGILNHACIISIAVAERNTACSVGWWLMAGADLF